MAANWYQISSAILADLQTCFGYGTPDCTYKYFVSLGEAPADCSSISISHNRSVIKQVRSKCDVVTTDYFQLVVTKCCLLESETFNPVTEDQNAQCFLDDFGDIFECLICNLPAVLKPFSVTCDMDKVTAALSDPTIAGGCYTGVVNIALDRYVGCCP